MSWSYWWTPGSQPTYNQFDVGGCASGCGATAWAMLFGWADRQAASGNAYWAPRWGLYRANGGYGADVVAPIGMDAGVRSVTLELRTYLNTFCLFGQGATWPWEMADGWMYLNGRTGTRLIANWNSLGFHEDRLRNYARDSIKFRRTPAVIGTGWLSHYPMAFGYAYQERVVRRCFIWCWNETVYDRWFYVNQGWGGAGNDWVEASSWFAGEIAP